MNIYDISKKAGVSIATVSRVLNGSQSVSDKTRERVLAVMEQCGYTPNVFARGLGLGTMKTIGIMCSDSSDPYLANAIYYLERELRLNGYDSILCCTGYNLENKRNYLNLLLSKRVDAVILAGSKFIEMRPKDNAYLLEAGREVPLMLVNGYLEGENIYSTVCDDRAAMRQAAESLLSQGIRDILYLYTSVSYSGNNKLAGFREAFTDAGLTVNEALIFQCPKDMMKARELLNRLRGEGISFQAVLASDDALAVGALKYAHGFGLSVPEDLSVIGYNNSILATCTDPELTSVDTKVEALCVTTVQTLMGVFNGTNVPKKTTIAADFIRRETTKHL